MGHLGKTIPQVFICFISVILHNCGGHGDRPFLRDNLSAFKITDEFMMDTTVLVEIPDDPIAHPMYDSVPTPIHQQQAEYPLDALESKTEGDVWVRAFLDSTGKVIYAYIAKSDTVIFNKSSLQAIIQWKFTPAVFKSRRYSAWVSVPFRFRKN